ncbi:EF-hand calcium-binding domain-containing protein 6, partial [Lates japonicus]
MFTEAESSSELSLMSRPGFRWHIQHTSSARILDMCIHLTDKEFQRLWNHYSPSNTATISYELFLDKLGFGDSHNFKIAPVCTKLEVSSRVTTPCDRVKQRKQRAGSLSNSCNAPSVLPHRKLQTLFYDKMCMNSTPVWQALQAFDTAHSGLVKQDVLRAVLSSFIFPMNPHSFQKLTSRYGVRATGPVRWKHFLSHFMSPGKEDGNTNLQLDRVSKQPAPDEDNLDFQEIYPRLKEIFHLLDTKEAGGITRADLRHLLERPGGTQPRLQRSQITELFNVLDPEHTGVIQLASLERFDPSITSAPTGNTAPPPSPPNTAEPLDIPKETEDTTTEMEEQKTPDERQTTQWADKVSVASASWRTVKSLLQDKLCEQLSSVLADLKLCDPQHTGHVTQEDLKKVLSCYGMPISDTHFNKLCEPFSSRPGTSSTLVSYNCFIRNLGVPLQKATNTSSPHKERPFTSPQSPLQSVEGQRPPSSLQDCPDTCSILDTVFQRMRLRLEQHQTSLTDRIQAIIHSSEETLSETDVRKILEDSWIVLDNKTFKMFTELLGFMDGQIERSVFQAKYEEAVARDRQQGSEGGDGDRVEVDTLPTSAEQCLAAMKNRIKAIHGNNLTAFRLMDKKHKGVVDCHDFRTLYNSLGFFCREGEYERLLDLIGLHPGGNLNYAEFIDIVENNGKQRARATSVQEQLHELLACEARCKWGDISKALCQFDADGQGWIHKKSLRGLLFTYALPISSNEFDQLWSRYDPEGQGCVAVCDFLEKLGFHHEGELKSLSQKLNQTVAQLDANRQVSTDAASLENIQLKVSMDDNCKRLSYMDFLSAFDSKAERKCEPPLASPDPVRQIESLDNLSPDVALARMRELVTATAPNLYKAFSAFDQSGTGTVRALEFRQVLESFCAHPSDKQYRYILSKLELDCENCTVNWKDFLSKFQSQEPVVQEDVTGHQKITKELMDLDTSNSTTISKEQFRQLCDRHCLSLTNDQMPVSERRKLQHREVLQSFGALSRTTHIEAGGPINNIPSPSPEPRETTSRSKPCCPNAAGAILQRTK